MMSILHDWYPGDRALEFVLIVTAGVALISGVAWMVSCRLTWHPASRHLVLISALFGCLAMPVLAAALSASGCAIISIPILPVESTRVGPDIPRVNTQRSSPVQPAARDLLETAADGPGDSMALPQSRDEHNTQ